MMNISLSRSSARTRIHHGAMDVAGFTLIEFIIVLAVIGIVSAMAFVAFSNALPNIRADSAMQLLEAQLRQARETSVDQRRNVQVVFKATNEMVTLTCTVPDCSSTTPLSDYFLPNGMVYTVVAGVPDVPAPDNYGNGYSVTFGCTSLPCTITFQSDGSVLDGLSGTGDNGTIFIGKTGQVTSARAVTILIATGKIKGYRYTGAVWH